MNENEVNSVNLSANLTDATFKGSEEHPHFGFANVNIQDQPVYAPVYSSETTVNSTDNNPVQNSEESTAKVVSKSLEDEIVVKEKFELNVEMFKKMLSNARKASKCLPTKLATSVFEITMNEKFLKVSSTDSFNTLVQVNNKVRFKNSTHFNVPSDIFERLISNLDSEYIELKLDSSTRNVLITTDDGSLFYIPEAYDREADGSSIVLETTPWDPDNDNVTGDPEIEIDYAEFKSIIQSAHSLSLDDNDRTYMTGVYCSDFIYSTNVESMFAKPNLPQLTNYSFYMPRGFVELFLSLNFNANVKIVLKNYGDESSQRIIIKDNKMLLEGVCKYEDFVKYPLASIKEFVNTSYNTKFTIKKSKLENVLKLASLFITPQTDKESCLFTLDIIKGVLDVTNLSKRANQTIPVQGLVTDISPFYLRIKDFLAVLNNCISEDITIEVDATQYRNIRIVDNNCILVNSMVNIASSL